MSRMCFRPLCLRRRLRFRAHDATAQSDARVRPTERKYADECNDDDGVDGVDAAMRARATTTSDDDDDNDDEDASSSVA